MTPSLIGNVRQRESAEYTAQVRDFESPSALSAHLHWLLRNDSAYLECGSASRRTALTVRPPPHPPARLVVTLPRRHQPATAATACTRAHMLTHSVISRSRTEQASERIRFARDSAVAHSIIRQVLYRTAYGRSVRLGAGTSHGERSRRRPRGELHEMHACGRPEGAHPCHICPRTGLAPATSAPGRRDARVRTAPGREQCDSCVPSGQGP